MHNGDTFGHRQINAAPHCKFKQGFLQGSAFVLESDLWHDNISRHRHPLPVSTGFSGWIDENEAHVKKWKYMLDSKVQKLEDATMGNKRDVAEEL